MKLYRALVRVVSTEEDPVNGKFLRVLVPASLCKDVVRIPASQVPESVRRIDARMFARATLDATDPAEMIIEGPYEVASEPDPKDGLS
jgi:hypothetical protein